MRHFIYLIMAMLPLTVSAESIDIKTLRVTEPISSLAPFSTDSTDVFGKPWDESSRMLDGIANLSAWKQGKETTDSIIKAPTTDAVRLAGFTIENRNFTKISVKAVGSGRKDVYIDGEKSADKSLKPGRHEVVIALLQEAGKADTLRVSVESEAELDINPTWKQPYTLETLMNGERMGSVRISADGQYLVLDKTLTNTDTKVEQSKWLIDIGSGNRTSVPDFIQWTSKGHRYMVSHSDGKGATTYELVDAATGKSETLLTTTCKDRGYLLPGEKQMLVFKRTEGPKEDKDVFQVLMPDDRQPGWRDRNNIALLDIESGQLRTITQGQHDVSADLSPDGKKMLLTISENEITERPFIFFTALVLDLETMQADTLFTHDGFVAGGQWSPDGKSVVFQGSPEAFGGIANRVPEGMTPSMIEQELFLIKLPSKEIVPLTVDLDPSIIRWEWSKADGMIYALCENRDNQDIFRIDPQTCKATMLKLSERFVLRFSLAEDSPTLAYCGQGHSNSDRLYVVNLKSGKEQLVEDLDAVRMKDIELGEFGEWNFKAERGDTIYGRYYLPPHFDPSQKYPMLVYYYGGCSPVGRYLDSYYSFHGWAAMGYVVYVIQPSGCTGFGQEFSARHVNAYGDYTADDIIQGTKQFTAEHSWVNADKIGCLGASYGGFMTQYLQTQTDIFAAAVSHAGISDPSSYWGYGYWGYSYSAVSAANSYPWNNPQLFNDHAPLNLADRVHTPILFMHGNADTNVPINESIQMFTALKILGRECAFVTVDGQDHHILDYNKRIKWQDTIYAWFQKWLKDDPSWWEAMYPTKNLK
ncbi:MAG: prolyl oligopeptidase family serine peptidase [Prevotellaceae bacterium]|nr:prolyl oligopeptidase family serine peptidase [Prevotellaceae bacterium]